MAYNTFPTFQGTGWNIKKRQLWSTDVEVSASGAEFRTGYWANPIYEFDMSINYMSQADKATLEAFYVGQQGPLIPFLLVVPNEGNAYTNAAVGAGNGTQTKWALPAWPSTTSTVYVAGVATTAYTLDTSGNITFTTAPANGAAITWSGHDAFLVRFVDDQTSGGRSTGGTSSPLEINQFMSGMYEQAGITFRTVR